MLPCVPFSSSVSGSSIRQQCVCNAGYTGMGNTTCEACAAGKYKSSSDVACVQCPVDTYSTHVAATGIATCAVCPALTTSVVGASAKTQCVSQIGTFSAGPGEAAEYCSPGKYQNEPDKTHCESCGVGKYQPLYGATSTAQCLD